MKRFLRSLLCVTLCAVVVMALAACNEIVGNYDTIEVSAEAAASEEEGVLESAVEASLYSQCNFEKYGQRTFNNMVDDMYELELSQLESYAEEYEVSADSLAVLYGYESADDYASYMAKSQVQHAIMYEALAKDLGLTISDEELDQYLVEYIQENELSISVSAMKQSMGESWLYVYRNYTLNRDNVLAALMDKVVISEE